MNAVQRLAAATFVLGLLASVARAVPAGTGVTALKRSAADADVFSQAADGAIERASLAAAEPAVSVDAGASAGLISTRVARRDFAAEPPAVFVPRAAPPRAAWPVRDSALAATALEGGLVLALVAAGLWRALPATDEVPAATAATGDPMVCALAAPAPAAPSFVADSPAPAPRLPEPFVDARMPVGTWRAISQREQALIESWDLSREKALGLASLEQWLDAHPAAGVDVAALKSKLARA
ncbi:MAG: hypothetical protein HKL90_14665 [Elusimicrobia bacterium]|nr:hypothetical protein [Elusimicrobiota bacterium]